MSGRKPGSGSSSRAVEARLSAAMAIYAGAASPGGGPVSDDDYFTDDGRLDPNKMISPRNQYAGDGGMAEMTAAAIKSPTNARNARLSGAAPPPTLGEIESHLAMNDSSPAAMPSKTNMASPGGRSTVSTSSGANRTRPMPENGTGPRQKKAVGGGGGFFDESFEDAFPGDNVEAFNTSLDRGSGSNNNRATAPSPSAQRRANKGAAGNKGVLHDPFGTMPSIPTPTAAASGGGASSNNNKSTSVAAKRRAKAAASGKLVVNTALTSPNNAAAANNNNAASPTTMLDFALQGTPVGADGANAGYPSDDDEEGTEGVLGAVASPKSWKGAASGSSKVDTSREGLIRSDDLSPRNAPTMMSDAEARLEEERERKEAEEKKNRFLSKMILRVSIFDLYLGMIAFWLCWSVVHFFFSSSISNRIFLSISVFHLQGKKEKKLATTPRTASAMSKPAIGSDPPSFSEAVAATTEPVVPSPSSSPMAADRSNVVDSNQIADDPPLDIVDADDSSDEENNLVDGANKLASAMMELLGAEGSDNTSGGAKQASKSRAAAAAGADPFEFAPIGGGQSRTTANRGAVDAPDDEPPSLRPATPPPAPDAKPQDAVEAMRSPSPGPSVSEFIDLGDPSASAKPSFADKFAQRGMDRRSSAQRFAAAASNGGNDIYQPSLTSSRPMSSDSPGGPGSHRRTPSGRGLRTLSSKKAEKPQSILRNSTMTPPRTKVTPVKKAAQPDLVSDTTGSLKLLFTVQCSFALSLSLSLSLSLCIFCSPVSPFLILPTYRTTRTSILFSGLVFDSCRQQRSPFRRKCGVI